MSNPVAVVLAEILSIEVCPYFHRHTEYVDSFFDDCINNKCDHNETFDKCVSCWCRYAEQIHAIREKEVE